MSDWKFNVGNAFKRGGLFQSYNNLERLLNVKLDILYSEPISVDDKVLFMHGVLLPNWQGSDRF